VPIEVTIAELVEEGRHAAAERVLKLHEEIAELIGDCQ
jgi:hypothetical protein